MTSLLKRKKRTASPLIWLLIYLIIIPMQLSGYVLCIGADGHVAFEAAADGRCTDTHVCDSEHAAVTIAGTTEEDHCGSCIDLAIFVSLNTQLYLVPTNCVSTYPTVSSCVIATDQKSIATILPVTHLQDLSPFINPTLISLRTTTLLI